ncbi:hypothetical protein MAR_021348, partial [Mya arenaria]
SSQPSPCAPGTYAPEQNHTTCITCPVGFYCKEQASLFVTYCRTDQRALMFPSVTFNDGSQSRAYQTWKSITVANDTYCHTVPYSGLTVAEQFDILCDKLPVLDPVIVQYKLSILTDGIEVMANVGSSCNMTDLVLMSGKPEEDFILQLHYAVTYYGDIVWDTRFQAQVTEPPVLTEEMVQEMDNVTSQVRSHVINKLSEIDAQDAQLVNALSFTLSTVVKKPDQITSEAKTQSVSIYSKLVKAYKNSSAEVSQTDLAGTARY